MVSREGHRKISSAGFSIVYQVLISFLFKNDLDITSDHCGDGDIGIRHLEGILHVVYLVDTHRFLTSAIHVFDYGSLRELVPGGYGKGDVRVLVNVTSTLYSSLSVLDIKASFFVSVRYFVLLDECYCDGDIGIRHLELVVGKDDFLGCSGLDNLDTAEPVSCRSIHFQCDLLAFDSLIQRNGTGLLAVDIGDSRSTRGGIDDCRYRTGNIPDLEVVRISRTLVVRVHSGYEFDFDIERVGFGSRIVYTLNGVIECGLVGKYHSSTIVRSSVRLESGRQIDLVNTALVVKGHIEVIHAVVLVSGPVKIPRFVGLFIFQTESSGCGLIHSELYDKISGEELVV